MISPPFHQLYPIGHRYEVCLVNIKDFKNFISENTFLCDVLAVEFLAQHLRNGSFSRLRWTEDQYPLNWDATSI